jgi:hypothetical protein
LVSVFCLCGHSYWFFTSAHDLVLFVNVSPRGRTLLLLYVDGMIITGDDPKYITFVKTRLSDQFLISDLGPLRYCLEIEISSMPEGFFVSREVYSGPSRSSFSYWSPDC